MRSRGGRSQARLPMVVTRGDNVKVDYPDPWPEADGFDGNIDNKRRKTTRSSLGRPIVNRQASVIDLDGEDEDTGITILGTKEIQVRNMTGQMLPPSSPHRLSGKASSTRPSQRSARFRTSVASSFGQLPELESIRKTTSRPPSRRGLFSNVPHHGENTQQISTRSDNAVKRNSHGSGSDSNRIYPQNVQDSDTERHSLQTPAVTVFEDEDEDMEVVKPQAADEVSSKQRIAELEEKATRDNPYRRANQKKHQQALSSDDELANSDQAFDVRQQNQTGASALDGRRTNARSTGTQRHPEIAIRNGDDIEQSRFTRSHIPFETTIRRPNAGDKSGWMIQTFASSDVSIIEGEINLRLRNQRLTITYFGETVIAVNLMKVNKCTYNGKHVVFTGPDDYWAAMKFLYVPDRLGFTGQLRGHDRQIQMHDPLDSGVMEGLFSKAIMNRSAETNASLTGQEVKTDTKEAKVRKSRINAFDTASAEAQQISERRADERRPKKLISQMQTSEQGQLNQESQPPQNSGASRRPRRGQHGSPAEETSTAFAFGEGGQVQGAAEGLLRRSDRKAKGTTSKYFDNDDKPESVQDIVPEEERYSRNVGLGDKWEFSLTYPLTGKDRATVDFQDLERLDDGEFLNDNLIEFYLRWARQQRIDQGTHAGGQVHFFNTFFYEKLASGGRAIDYKAVESWTRKVDIFDIDYIIVPVNENAHWYVCIICNLPKLNQVEVDLTGDVETGETQRTAESADSDIMTQLRHAAEADTASIKAKGISDIPIKEAAIYQEQDEAMHKVEHDLAFAKDSQDGPYFASVLDKSPSLQASPDSTLAPIAISAGASQDSVKLTRTDGVFKNAKVGTPKSSKTKRRKSGPTPRKYDPKTTIVITLDSLGLTHAKTTSNLKEYIIAEGAAKHKLNIQKEDIKGMNVTRGIPQQQNFCDCGVFLLGYIHKFLADPRGFVTKILANEMDEVEDWPDMDPKALRANVRDTIQKTYQDQLPARQSMKKRRKVTPASANTTDASVSGVHSSAAASVQVDQGDSISEVADSVLSESHRSASDTNTPEVNSNTIRAKNSMQETVQQKRGSASKPITIISETADQNDKDSRLSKGETNATRGVDTSKSDEDMLFDPIDGQREIQSGQASLSEALRCLKRSHKQREVEEIPDSQEGSGRRSKSPGKEETARLESAVEGLEGIIFPPFPSRQVPDLHSDSGDLAAA